MLKGSLTGLHTKPLINAVFGRMKIDKRGIRLIEASIDRWSLDDYECRRKLLLQFLWSRIHTASGWCFVYYTHVTVWFIVQGKLLGHLWLIFWQRLNKRNGREKTFSGYCKWGLQREIGGSKQRPKTQSAISDAPHKSKRFNKKRIF